MSREVQIAYAAAHLAWEDAGLTDASLQPDRIGVVYGSEIMQSDKDEIITAVRLCSTGPRMDASRWGEVFPRSIAPLWMLRNLPNMPPCHIAIAINARGPNNTIAMEEVSGLLAVGEAVSVIQRGDADLMVVGAMGARTSPARMLYRHPGLYLESPLAQTNGQAHCRPFDLHRQGIVPAEAAVVLILERRRHAAARQARILGRVAAAASRCGRPDQPQAGSSQAIATAAAAAMAAADITAADLACVSPQGYSQEQLDRTEAQAIERVAATVPVTAFSSYFGTAGAASSLLQLAAGILATNSGQVLPTLGFTQPDPNCPVTICQHRQASSQHHLLQLSFTFPGQAAAVVVEC